MATKRHTTPAPALHLRRIFATIPAAIFFTALILPLQAQLPAGTTDATQPKTQKQDPLQTQANEALDKHDYPTALKLLTTLNEKSPNDPHPLYDPASTPDALDQTSAAEAPHRPAIPPDPTSL